MNKSIILAAGKGTRMRSDLPKVVHKLCGREMVNRVLDVTKEAGCEEDIVIVGYQADVVKNAIDRDVKFALQTEQLGTGHAVKMAIDYINDDDTVVILCGDTPLLKSETISDMISFNKNSDADITLSTFVLDDGGSYGRIVKDENGNVMKVVEFKDCNDEEKNIKEVNVGLYVVNGKVLKDSLQKINNNNAQHEYYLTEIISIANADSKIVNTYTMKDLDEGRGVNSPEDLEMAEKIFINRK